MKGYEVKIIVHVEAETERDAESIASDFAYDIGEKTDVLNAFVDGSYELDEEEYSDYLAEAQE